MIALENKPYQNTSFQLYTRFLLFFNNRFPCEFRITSVNKFKRFFSWRRSGVFLENFSFKVMEDSVDCVKTLFSEEDFGKIDDFIAQNKSFVDKCDSVTISESFIEIYKSGIVKSSTEIKNKLDDMVEFADQMEIT